VESQTSVGDFIAKFSATVPVRASERKERRRPDARNFHSQAKSESIIDVNVKSIYRIECSGLVCQTKRTDSKPTRAWLCVQYTLYLIHVSLSLQLVYFAVAEKKNKENSAIALFRPQKQKERRKTRKISKRPRSVSALNQFYLEHRSDDKESSKKCP